MAQNLRDLRDEVRRAHILATKKVSRMRSKGVEIGGTDLDPRRNLGNVKRYTAKQLNAYLNDLERFRSRQTSYVQNAQSKIISGAKWREYKRLEREFNRRAQRAYGQVSDVFLPSHGMTVAERDALMRNRLPGAAGSHRPFDVIDRDVRWIVNERALDKLTADMRKRLSKGFEADQLRRQRSVSRKMLKGVGNRDFRKRLGELSDKQFNILWNYTNFTTLLASKYHGSKDGSPAWLAKVADDSESSINEYLGWAEKLR